MSEYWVSKKKYFCKYCDIYIQDDAPSRRQHENGLRHKGNRDRFVRGLYKEGERKKKDLAEEKREVARVEAAANAAFAKDVHSGIASSSSSRQEPTPKPVAQKPQKPASVWSNYSTAQSLGYTDPDEERRQTELERRRTQGVIGEWEVVTPPPPPLVLEGGTEVKREEGEGNDATQEHDPFAIVQKREAEEPLEDERNFKLRKRKVDLGLGELWDPGDIPIKLKSKPNAAAEELQAGDTNQNEDTGKNRDPSQPDLNSGAAKRDLSTEPATGVEKKEKWQTNGWKRATAPVEEDASEIYQDPLALSDPIKQEAHGDTPEDLGQPAMTDENEKNVITDMTDGPFKTDDDDVRLVKQEETLEEKITPEASAGSLFRKRKVPAGGRGGRR